MNNVNFNNENRLAHLAELIDNKKQIDEMKKEKEEDILSSVVEAYSAETGKNITAEDFEKIKSLFSAKKKEKETKNCLDSFKGQSSEAQSQIDMYIRSCLDLLIEENGVYKQKLTGIGTVKYTPGLPYIFDGNEIAKEDILGAILEHGGVDCLNLDKEKYLELNQRYVEQQKEQNVPDEEIQYLPGIYDKGDLVLPGEVKITLSRAKKK